MIHIEYHIAQELENADTTARRVYYSASGNPSVFFDGGSNITGFNSGTEALYIAAVNERLLDLSQLTVEIASAEFEPGRMDPGTGTVSIRVEIAPGESIDPATSQIRAFLYEDNITLCCDPEGGDNWDRVARKQLPDVALTISGSGEFQVADHNFALDEEWDPENLHVVAWVQRDSDKYIWNAGRGPNESSDVPSTPEFPSETAALALWQNSPNPVNGTTTIRFAVPRSGQTEIAIFDATGRKVAQPLSRDIPAGTHSLLWDGRGNNGDRLPNGVYLYRLQTPGGQTSESLRILR